MEILPLDLTKCTGRSRTFSIKEGQIFYACGWVWKIHFQVIYGNPQGGGSRAERLSSLILEDTEVSGPFQTLTGGKYVKWVTWQMQGIHLPVCIALPQGMKAEKHCQWEWSLPPILLNSINIWLKSHTDEDKRINKKIGINYVLTVHCLGMLQPLVRRSTFE